MPTIAEVQAAADKLPVAGRVKLLEHLARDEAVRRKQLTRLRADLAAGERDLTEGRFVEAATPAALREFFDDVARRGRARSKRSA